ncbi:MAG TPA: hypothetical protein DEP72_02815 [Clostridiales bacterium]|nr:MAG: hypothetical protein A2Y18_01075 [Clostridiales bacterium GWD2_32_19]HCC07086.1 hypothetical protein [Clostridiales bacterium]
MESKKVVVIGGGTGQSIFLRGLKNYTDQITAVVTVADSGGGSGVLREDMGMLPPGDIRNCLLALANTEPVMQEVMQYRFETGKLKGQSFGNLFIAAMLGISNSFEEAVIKMSEFLAVKGRVMPVTLEDVHLIAVLDNGAIVKGEDQIPHECLKHKAKIEKLRFNIPNVKPYPPVLEAIIEADIIVIGPGSLYTSILPNLLVENVVDALRQSKAQKVYVCNVMSQPGETQGYTVIDHMNVIEEHIGKGVINTFIVNNKILNEEQVHKYENTDAEQILLDAEQREKLDERGINYVEGDVIEFFMGYIRHDADKLSMLVMNIADNNEQSEDIAQIINLSDMITEDNAKLA